MLELINLNILILISSKEKKFKISDGISYEKRMRLLSLNPHIY